MLPENTEYTRLIKPTLDQQYNVRSKVVRSTTQTMGRTRITVKETVATHGCFVDGYRRVWIVEKAATYLGHRATEVICYGHTLKDALAKAAKAL